MAKKFKCHYCRNPITEKSPSNHNCGCRTRPAPTSVSVGFVLAHDEYKKAVKEIAHLTIHHEKMSEQDMRKTLSEVAKTVKDAIVNDEFYKMTY
ncbi:hypothetical protein [Lysinibacillus varians]|uniref:Uncharacterized protein n=1 Tax=Lysinibacillus varians TaxID=1145276 RepID=A0ABY2T7V0_9BACI|nr:hypothetical protein [Lysinibacillus varians]AHN24484.1 hypothetical protein T479_20050 [Lysinibacillus varians]TKI60499.1 hypothetical protein FC752_15030 [Lysinibacillus varians]